MLKTDSNSTNTLQFFLIVLLVVTAIRLYLIQLPLWPINGDEAQYWLWGKQLDWGYYSKPPMIAWLVSLSSFVFGDQAMGLRFFSPVLNGLTALICYFIANKLYDSRIAFWCGISFLLAPGISFATQLISTDTPLLFFWGLSLWMFLRITEKNRWQDWMGLSFFLGLAILSKYAAIFFLIGIIFYFIFEKKQRNLLKPGRLILFVLVLLLVLAPNIYWNMTHHFASFKAVKDNADVTGVHFNYKEFINFIGSQFIMFSPVLFAGLIFSFLFKLKILIKNEKFRFMLYFIFPVFITMLTESIISRAHANWSAPMYISATLLVVPFLCLNYKKHWLYQVLFFNGVVFFGFMAVKPLVQLAKIHLPLSMSVIDWTPLQKKLQQQLQIHPDVNIIVDDRMLFANVAYFSKVPYGKIYKWNPQHLLRDHFDLTKTLNLPAQGSYILMSYSALPDDVFPYFFRNSFIGAVSLPTLDGRENRVYFYELQGVK